MPEPEKTSSSHRTPQRGSTKDAGTMTDESGIEPMPATLKLPVASALENALTRTPNSATSEKPKRRPPSFDFLSARWDVIRAALGPRYEDCRIESFDVTDPNPKYAAA